MQLFGDPASPYVTRVVMLARLKGVALQRPPVPGDNPRSEAWHAINPLGKVPGLVLPDGRMIPESELICEYLEDAFPGVPGLPADPVGRMTSRLVARVTDLYISPRFQPLLPHLDPGHRDQKAVDEIGAGLAKAFRALDFYMADGSFCAGEQPGIGDCALGTYMQLLKHVIFPAFDTIADPTASPGRLAAWWAALQGHKVCRAVLDDYGRAVDEFMAANRETLHEHR